MKEICNLRYTDIDGPLILTWMSKTWVCTGLN
jgi:hypothetical protein